MSKEDIEKLYSGELAITDPSEIDIEAIAFYKGATVKERILKGCEARIIGHGDRAIITVNALSSQQRKRFSIGHELGHWFKHRGSVGNLCKKQEVLANRASLSKSVSGKEKVANNYAAELLMPQYLFRSSIQDSTISFDVIIHIKEVFDVSLTAGAIRYVDFCDYPVVLACYGQTGREWYHKSQYVPDYFYPVRSINRDSPSFKSANAGLTSYKPVEVDADGWIDFSKADNHVVWEVVWPIGDGRYMVFLWWENDLDDIDHGDEYLEELSRPSF